AGARRHRAAGQRHGGRCRLPAADGGAGAVSDGCPGGARDDGSLRLWPHAARVAAFDLYGGRSCGAGQGGGAGRGAGAAQSGVQSAADDVHAAAGGVSPVSVKRLTRDVSWFLLAGALSAVAQYASLVLLAELARIDPVPASFLAFLAGGTASYLLNHRFTFQATSRHGTAAPRFFLVAMVGLCLNTLLMA